MEHINSIVYMDFIIVYLPWLMFINKLLPKFNLHKISNNHDLYLPGVSVEMNDAGPEIDNIGFNLHETLQLSRDQEN